MRKGVFSRIKALVQGRFICRIYVHDDLVYECLNFMLACNVLARYRKAFPDKDFVLKLEEV